MFSVFGLKASHGHAILHMYTLNKKIIEWPMQFRGHGAAQAIPCPVKESGVN